jgi:hypothetical protein
MFIIFWNKTDLPLMVDTWLEGVNQLTCLKIHPYERCVLHSRTGEWYLNTILNTEDKQLWIDKGLAEYTTLGKFRLTPCAQGDYAWMESDIFRCTYTANNEISFSIVGGIK